MLSRGKSQTTSWYVPGEVRDGEGAVGLQGQRNSPHWFGLERIDADPALACKGPGRNPNCDLVECTFLTLPVTVRGALAAGLEEPEIVKGWKAMKTW